MNTVYRFESGVCSEMFEVSDKDLVEWFKFVVESLHRVRYVSSSHVREWNECAGVFRDLINFFTSKLLNQVQTLNLPPVPPLEDAEIFYAEEIAAAEAECVEKYSDAYSVYTLVDVVRACRLMTTEIVLQKLMVGHICKNRYQPQEVYQSSTYKFIVEKVCPKLVLPDHIKLTPPALIAVSAAADYMVAELLEPVWQRSSLFTHLRSFILHDKALVPMFAGCKLKLRTPDSTFDWRFYDTI